MRLPSGATPAPWLTSIPLITPTTVLVAGSMMWTLSPALLVWMIRTLFCAPADVVHRAIPATTASHVPTRCVCLIGELLLPGFAQHPFLHDQPLRVVLRVPVLAAAVIEIAAGRLYQGMNQELALGHAAGYHESPDRFEVLARVLIVPARAAWRQRLQPHRRPRTVARNTARMPFALRQKDRLHPGLEIV